MKKMIALSMLLVSIAVSSIGCTTTSSLASPCRSGSLWPSSRTSTQQVYMTSASMGVGGQCDPCAQASCNPCEPACNPCVPACDPCAPGCLPTQTILPGVTH